MDRLLQDIFEDPASMEKRLVYADALMERGDPRGTFIRLQCLPDPGPRERRQAYELFRRHRKDWLGPLWPLVVRPRFEAGFLAACGFRMNNNTAVDALEKMRRHPVWNTVKHVTIASHNRSTFEMVMDDDWPSLTSVSGLWDAGQVRAVLLGRPRPWTRLGIRRVSSWAASSRHALHEALREGPGLPELSTLQITEDMLEGLRRGYLVRRLRRLVVQLRPWSLRPRILSATDVPLLDLRFSEPSGLGGWSVLLDRTQNRMGIHIRRLGGIPDPPRPLLWLLERLRDETPVGAVQITDDVPGQQPPGFVSLKRLAWVLVGSAEWSHYAFERPESVSWPDHWWDRLERGEAALPSSWPRRMRLSPYFSESRPT